MKRIAKSVNGKIKSINLPGQILHMKVLIPVAVEKEDRPHTQFTTLQDMTDHR